jgi:hypothetical protein
MTAGGKSLLMKLENLPEPDVQAREITDDLQTALEQFSGIAEELKFKV